MLRHTLLRVVRFRARHHYGRDDWSDERNRQVFGAQAESHEHDWRIELAVTGSVDPETGFVVDLEELDSIVQAVILGPLDGGDLNRAIPAVVRGEMQPSTEAIAGWIHSGVSERLPDGLRLRRVRVWESGELGAEVEADPEPSDGTS